MARIDNTRLVITGYRCSYSPCSSNNLFKFWTAQAILRFLIFSFLRGSSWKLWNKDEKVDFTSLKMRRVFHAYPKIADMEPTYRVTWSSDNVVMCEYVTN